MSTGGKIGTWFCVVCACAALYFAVWTIKARSGWLKQYEDANEQYERLADEEPTLRRKVEQLTAQVDTLEMPWGQFADATFDPQTGVNITPQPNFNAPADASDTITPGDRTAITLKLQPGGTGLGVGPGSKLHLFKTDAGGHHSYAGRFRVENATQQGVIVVRPDFKVRSDVNWMTVEPTENVKTFAAQYAATNPDVPDLNLPPGASDEDAKAAIQPAMQVALKAGAVTNPALYIDAFRASDGSLWRSPGKWRVRNRIPPGYDEEFLNLRTDITRIDERRARTTNFLAAQKRRVESADEALEFQRNVLLSGTEAQDQGALLPQEVVDGLVTAIREEESKRNAALKELDRLRHRLHQAMTRYQKLREGNQDLAQQLPGGKDSSKQTASLAPQPSAP